ncbi:AbgT family transporter [Alkalitalea saponilacus]|uniref:Aminobenzoyl-glutamate transport protein n=1 Tax=Alkalitalea saponilacus TaxID=889453 RepID=A0A1T5E0R3_9BACT|nr:AbgT family transporter [Alkalitalea saponilacus]ASB49136.1 AbgT transporter [Alkalitalea saponilacus]SKB77350.1 aminobenzoyl-glutamate transport protein [Alkalitalea saponilacus]
MTKVTASTTKSSGLLKWVEQLGNKLPHPFWMFVWITIIIIATSAVAALFGLSATDPGTGEEVFAKNLVSGEGLRRFLEEMVTNFAHFAPFGLVLVMLMGVSVAERSGLLTIVLRTMAFAVPRKVVLPFIFIIGACGNIGSDAGVVIVPPIAALIFMQMGLHPIAGLIAGYAGATAGFTANFFIAGTDVLLAGISTEVATGIDPDIEVSATANWYFMIASTVMLGLGGAFIVSRFTIPKCKNFAIGDEGIEAFKETPKLTPEEKKGMVYAGLSVLIFIALIAAMVIPDGAPLRNQETGGIVPSPFLRGLVPILFFFFAIPGYVYGKITGSIKKPDDLLKFMEQGMKDLSGYIVLMLVVAQFINLFSWSRLDTILAINGAEFLQSSGLTGPFMFTLFMMLVAFLNIFIGSGSAKWAIFAPIFIPMLAQLGYSPAFIQLMYRVGDSITNCISPLYIYFPLLIGWVRKYDKNIGIGTIISLLIPYAVVLFIMWVVLLFVWYWLGIPIGVGEGIYL